MYFDRNTNGNKDEKILEGDYQNVCNAGWIPEAKSFDVEKDFKIQYCAFGTNSNQVPTLHRTFSWLCIPNIKLCC